MRLKPYKNLALLLLLITLSAFAYWLLFHDPEDKKKQFAESFSLPDDVFPDKITIENKGTHIEKTLKQINQEWHLNETVKAKANLTAALLSILQQIEVKRGVAKKQEAALLAIMDSSAVLVKTYKSDKLLNAFEIWGDRESETTYIRQPSHDKIYIAHIPGHNTYIAALFFLKEDQWENNTLFESTPRSLKSLTVEYPLAKERSFTIRYSNNFFIVSEVEKLDTAALLNYLEAFSKVALQSVEVDTGTVDNLLQKKPNLIVTIDDWDTAKSNVYRFYLESEKGRRGGIKVIGKEKQLGKLSELYFEQVAKTKDYFIKEESKQ